MESQNPLKSEDLNDFFQRLCKKDAENQFESPFGQVKKFLGTESRLNVSLPPLQFPHKTVKPLQETKKNEMPINPIPWRSSQLKKPQSPQKSSKSLQNYCNFEAQKRKNLAEEDFSYPKSAKPEVVEFVSAKNLLDPSQKNPSPCKRPLSSAYKRPFTCPLKGSEPVKEESKFSGIEEKLVEMIESEIITRNPCIKWSDIAGLDFAKKTVNEVIVWPLKRPDLFRGLRAPPKGLLLFGPPGTGKTMIGKAIASEVSATFFSISASSITSKWVGEGEKLVKVLFALAVKNQPSVIFIDEIDSLLSSRSDNEQEGSRRIKTEFLVQIDGAATNPDDRVLLIGATNRPQELDEAMRRRLSKRMFIPLPNKEGRTQIVKNLLACVPNCITENDLEIIVKKSKGYSGSDMKFLCTEASMVGIRKLDDICSLNAEEIPPVMLEHFEEAFKSTRASVAKDDIKVLMEWNQNFGTFQFDYCELDT